MIMRTPIILLAAVAAFCCVAADKPAADQRGVLPTVLTQQMLAKKDSIYTLHPVKFDGQDYFVADAHLGYGVAHKHIGIYAPEEDGTFHLCLFAESWAAGSLQISLDAKTGVLELRERANSKLKGEIVFACNLKTIGTQSSTRTK
jgi:hypothetical protein